MTTIDIESVKLEHAPIERCSCEEALFLRSLLKGIAIEACPLCISCSRRGDLPVETLDLHPMNRPCRSCGELTPLRMVP